MKRIIKWFMNTKLYNHWLKKHNEKITEKCDNYMFLKELCKLDDYTLDLNKFLRLMSMVKRKYKK